MNCNFCNFFNAKEDWCDKYNRITKAYRPCMDSMEGDLKDWQVTHPTENLNKSFEDPVNHPSHYTDGKIEVIDFNEDKKLGFHLGNAVKYISRAGKKNPEKEIEDLEKAIWYIKRYIQEYKEARTPISK